MHRGLADSTHRTYNSGVNRFRSFCDLFSVSHPFPVSERLLCSFVAALARQGLAPSTTRTYLAAIRHAQVVGGFPEPRAQSSLPRLRLVQSGARRDRAQTGQPPSRTRLPITPPILRRMRESWTGDGDDVMLWAAALSCFFGFFRAGEITVPSATAFDPAAHLAWGDVSSTTIRSSAFFSSVQRRTSSVREQLYTWAPPAVTYARSLLSCATSRSAGTARARSSASSMAPR